MKPTIIHIPEEEKDKMVSKKALKSTVIPSNPTNPKATSQEVASVNSPTIIPGTIRKRIDVTVLDLRKCNESSSEIVLEKALKLILTVDLEYLSSTVEIPWGQDLQKKFDELISYYQLLLKHDVVVRVNGYLGRLIQILESFNLRDLERIGNGTDLATRLVKKIRPNLDPVIFLPKIIGEINELKKLLKTKCEELLKIKKDLKGVVVKMVELAEEIETYVAASNFLVEYTKENPTKTRLFIYMIERSMSLTETLTQSGISEIRKGVRINEIDSLIDCISDAVSVTVPKLVSDINSVVTMLETKQYVTTTGMSELDSQKQQITTRLKERK